MSLPLPQSVTGDSAAERLRALHLSGQLPFKGGELLGQGVVGRDV